MNSLILDCSCGMNVFVLKDKDVFFSCDSNNKKHTDDLLVTVDSLLAQAGLLIHDIENVGVCAGPGSFTGIRVAISMVKGLAVNLKAKIFEMSNFDAFYGIEDKKYVCVLDGFSNFVYARFVNGDDVLDECIDAKELAEKVKTGDYGKVYVLLEKTQNALNKNEISSIIAENNVILAFNKKVERNENISLNQISPVYLRASQAEIERNKKLNLE